MIKGFRSIFADECRARRAVIGHAIIRSDRGPFQAPRTRNTIGPSTAPHFFETKVVWWSKIAKHSAIGISSGGCRLIVSWPVLRRLRILQPVSYSPSTKITLQDAALCRISFALVYAGDMYHC